MPSWSSVWYWVIGCAAVANAAMVVATVSSRPETIAVARSAPGGNDADIEARLRYARSGAGLSCEPRANGVRLTLAGADLRSVAVVCERPADARLDRGAAWIDPAAPLDINLPAHGRWSVRLTALDAEGFPVTHVEEAMLP